MKCLSFLAAAAFSSVLFVSCKNQGTTGLPIPKDAAIVVHINSSSLTKKLTWKEIQSTEWFKEMYRHVDDSLQQKILDNPDNSGIDVKSDFVFFMKKQGRRGIIVFEGTLKNATAFEAMIKRLHKDVETKKDGDLSYMNVGKSDVVSWNDSKFVFMADAPFASGVSFNQGSGEDNSVSADSLRKFTKDLLALSRDNSIESNDHFTSLIKESGDIHFWMNMAQYYDVMGASMANNPVGSMMSTMTSFMKGTVATGSLNFDDGKITVNTKQYLGEQMAKVMNKYTFKPITADLVNRIPSQNVVGALVVSYPPEAMKEMLKASGMDGFVNMFLGKLNYSLDDLVQATKGQIVLAASDFAMTREQHEVAGQGYSYPTTKTDLNVLFALSVNNKASFDKMINIAHSQIQDSTLLSKVNYQTTNDWFAISNSPDEVQKFLAGGNNKLPFADKIAGHPFGLYIDLQKLMKGFANATPVNTGMLDISMNMWQDVVATGGDFKDGVSKGEFTINLVDKSTNSLKQLNLYGEKLYTAQKKFQEDMMKRYQTDSDTSVGPPASPGN